MYWFWLNMPLAAMFFAAWTGIPLWLVLKHPDTGPKSQALDANHQAHVAELTEPKAIYVHSSEHASDSQLLTDARR